jgi:hypothetical protein
MRHAHVPLFAFILALLVVPVAPATGATISIGSRIDTTPTSFALAIDIIDGVGVIAWDFDLRYDSADVQIATSCDPFNDAYCDLFTGPVTEGDFYASGAPFNLLIPGFVDLDPATFEQTGLLFGAHGEYGGALAPSGSGVIAYVLFNRIGTGDSPITIESGSVTEIPEPELLLLFTLGLPALAARRSRRTHERH